MMEIRRRTSKPVWIGKVQVGGDAPIVTCRLLSVR
jgi:4-hydroxy-3-methylbut-2-en-1-yl diphosphate synthase IspG/GcpE